MRNVFYRARCRYDFLVPTLKGVGIIFVSRSFRGFACVYGKRVFFYFARLQYRAVPVFKGYRVGNDNLRRFKLRNVFYRARCRYDFLIPTCKGISIVFICRFRGRFPCIYGKRVFCYFARLQYRAVPVFKGYRVRNCGCFFIIYEALQIIQTSCRASRLQKHIRGIRRNIRRELIVCHAVYSNRHLFILNRNLYAVPSIVIKRSPYVRDPLLSAEILTQKQRCAKRIVFTVYGSTCRSQIFFRKETYVELSIDIRSFRRRKINVKGNFLILRQIQRFRKHCRRPIRLCRKAAVRRRPTCAVPSGESRFILDSVEMERNVRRRAIRDI